MALSDVLAVSFSQKQRESEREKESEKDYQFSVLGSPKLIQPKMGTDTVRPLFPNRLYSHFDASSDCLTLMGSSTDIALSPASKLA